MLFLLVQFLAPHVSIDSGVIPEHYQVLSKKDCFNLKDILSPTLTQNWTITTYYGGVGIYVAVIAIKSG